MKTLTIPSGQSQKVHISELHQALGRLRLDIDPQEIKKQVAGQTTTAALKIFQRQNSLPESGQLDKPTVEKLNRELVHVHYAGNKTRTTRLHEQLRRLDLHVEAQETKAKQFGASTQQAIEQLQARFGLPVDGRMTEELINRIDSEALRVRFSTKTQIGQLHQVLLRAGRVGKLEVKIDAAELKDKNIGATTTEFLRSFQQKYKLPATGELDPATMERLSSVAASKPKQAKKLKAGAAENLSVVTGGALRLNMTDQRVSELQQTLAHMGYKIDESEFKTQTYGKTTREAVVAYQKKTGLPPTGHAESRTLQAVNQYVARTNVLAVKKEYAYRIRGSVRNDLWAGQAGVRIEVFEKVLRGADHLLATRNSLSNGFYDLPYDPPRNPADGQVKTPFHLLIRISERQADGTYRTKSEKTLFNPTLIAWANFTDGPETYQGNSEFETYISLIRKKVGSEVAIDTLVETDDNAEISFVATQTGLHPEDVLRLVLAHLAAANLNRVPLDAAVFYAFIRQNLPTTLPPDLLSATEGWEMIDQLVYKSVSGLLLMPPDLQQAAFDNAVKDNLIPISVTRQRDTILAALVQQKIDFTLNSSSLVGNGKLIDLLGISSIAEAHYPQVAQVFIQNQGLTPGFWATLQATPQEFGGLAPVQDLAVTSDVGFISKHFTPTLTFLKQQIEDPAAADLNKPKDLAKLDQAKWVALLNQNGGQVPPDTDGADPAEKVQTYAAILQSQSERLYPGVAMAAAASRSTHTGLTNLAAVQTLLDQDELDIRSANLDKFIADRNLVVTPEALLEAKLLQRVHRLTGTSTIAVALLNEKIHSSTQIYFLGKERFTKLLKNQGVDERTAFTLYGRAEFQYGHLLGLLTEWRQELQTATPTVIASSSFSETERQQLTAEVPDLELLFGPLDYCDCQHCQSVYSPAAYLTDLLRWLDTFPTDAGALPTVQKVLLGRRPDLQNIHLNCDNTNVALPYIDLVCEVLEQAFPPPEVDFSFQTTLTQAELRAFPENVRKPAYDVLRTANYPMHNAFDLWQEETRVFLNHLGVARYTLMDAFQDRSNPAALVPTDASTAGEFWGISTHEAALILSADATPAAQDKFWGFDTTQTRIPVTDFLKRTHLSYRELLELLSVAWINDLNAADRLEIERPVDTCDTGKQMVVHLTLQHFDQLHRFIRLWRHSGWAMWELDLLIRAPKIGNNLIDEACLVNLYRFRQIQDSFGLKLEPALSLFNGINNVVRVQPDQPEKEIKPLYDLLFKNKVISQLDPDLSGPLDGTLPLSGHKSALLAAFALRESDLDLLLAKTDGKLRLNNLSLVYNYVNLANGLKLNIGDLLIFQALTNLPDPFSSPQVLLEFTKQLKWVKTAGFSIAELEYILQHRPDSPVGLRDETITQYLEKIRESLRETPRLDALNNITLAYQNQIKAQIATTLNLSDEYAGLLLENLQLAGSLLSRFSVEALTKKNADGTYVQLITKANFSALFSSFILLHKAALLVSRFDILEKAELQWLLEQPAIASTLNFNDLPTDAAPVQALFADWERLAKWLDFKKRFPEPEGISLRAVYEMAHAVATPESDFLDALAKLTDWDRTYVKQLRDGLHFTLGAGKSFTDPDNYLRLAACFEQVRQLGVSPERCLAWANRDDDTLDVQFTIARQARQASKSKYDYAAWLPVITPLQDELRERKRKALVDWHLEQSQRTQPAEISVAGKTIYNPKYFNDSNDLFNFFLIDVEMSACMLTSRLKQAISSVQTFVQRCFLNLERPEIAISQAEATNTVALDSWSQWKWMKNYRVWEANRKVFLYPENWIEPELRDDKSPFFKELENEILQNDITHENVEGAFLNYLHKVNEVSRLEIVGTYHEVVDDNPADDLPPNVNRLHVIGRTHSTPALYFYRAFDLNFNTWTAWDKIDLDITGEHLVPVVYNRKLHLFWLNFVEKPQKLRKVPPAKADNNPATPPEPPKMLEIQLAWSIHKKDGWTAKKMSKQKLVHPWPRPIFSYTLKTRYKSRENQLWLDLYISTSKEFNDELQYDPYTNSFVQLTKTRWSETLLPWHSSSFVFDGEILAAKMKPILGTYHPLLSQGYFAEVWQSINSFDYVHGSFGADGARVGALSGPYEIAPRLTLPAGMHLENNHLVNNKQAYNPTRPAVVENGVSKQLLGGAKSPFNLTFSQQDIQFDTGIYERPFFYQDYERAFFIKPEWQALLGNYNQTTRIHRYVFFPFYHPYTPLFIRELNRTGLDGLLNRRIQTGPQGFYPPNNFHFGASYAPTSPNAPDVTAVTDTVDFSTYGAYSIYNWELFFHAPLLIANKLMQNQRFEEAIRWFHYIFDPTNIEGNQVPQRYWITKPFFEQNADDYKAQRIDDLLKNIQQNTDRLREWKNNPFQPHLIARYRLVAYQKTVVMKYLDNLIAWGDQLFRRDTIESINEATQLYILAYEILGRRPIKVPNLKHRDFSFKELAAQGLDAFGNTRTEVLVENFAAVPVRPIRAVNGGEPLPRMEIFYFCLPTNDKLLGYWDQVEDRLFKIRHCMNIEGVVRQLPLFEPPIDPALLVKAAAAGVDLSSVLNDMALPAGYYRFRVLAQKATEFCAEVKMLGDKVLSVLEKKDAEGLALLRSTQEIEILQAVKEVKKMQIREANENWAGLEKGLELAEEKKTYYDGREFMNTWEGTAMALGGISALAETGIALGYILSGGLTLIPKFITGASGFGGSPHVTVEVIDGFKFSRASEMAMQTLSAISRASEKLGALATSMGTYQRRKEEWDFQGRLANHEIEQLKKQISAATIRFAIAEKELDNQDLQIEKAQSADAYMHSKYTNQQLYDWMLGQLATIYFQSYQLAYDMAKRAEKCYQFELGVPTSSFIQFGYWDSLKKGLLAGEKLSNDIRRLEAAYMDQNRRELELTKHISLAQSMPLKLLELRETGACNIMLPEWLFDLDYPGHYRRRIKALSISIPCITGPYTSVNCTLTLTNNGIRLKDDVVPGYGDPLAPDTERFIKNVIPTSSIATSSAQNDSGTFELNFNDDRYLPFEGAGAVSEWRIEMPQANNQFDFSTISDVILHLRYTASSGSLALKNAAKANLDTVLPTAGLRLISLKQEFSSDWHKFLFPVVAGADQEMSFKIEDQHLPFLFRGKKPQVTQLHLLLETSDKVEHRIEITLPGAAAATAGTAGIADVMYGQLPHFEVNVQGLLLGTWKLKIKKTTAANFHLLQPEDIKTCFLLLSFKTAP